MRDLGDIYPSVYPVEGFPPVADSWLPLLHLEEFPNNHDHSQPFILKYQRCLIDFRTIHNMWSLLWSENKWDLGNVQRFIGSLLWADLFIIHYTDGFSIQYFTVVQGSQIYTPNQTGRGGIFCNHTPCLSHLLTFKCGHLMRVQIRQQLP